MKNWIKKIGQNKFQFFFFVGIVALLAVALIVSATLNGTDDPIDDIDTPTDVVPTPGDDEEAATTPEEVVILPFTSDTSYVVVRKFYEKSASKEDQAKALIKYGNTYRTSSGTGYAKTDNSTFDVISVLSGTVTEIKDSPLYGNYVVIEHSDTLKTRYYGLSEVTVTVGTKVKQGEKIGTSGNTDIDKEAGNHVYFQVLKENKYVNPESLIGKKLSEI